MMPPGLQTLFQDGIAAHQSGRMGEAKCAYAKVLALAPFHFDALHLLGAAVLQDRASDQAIVQIGRALRIQPHASPALNNRGSALKDSGRLLEAAANFQAALALDPANLDAAVNLGATQLELHARDPGIKWFRRVLRSFPEDAELHVDLAGAELSVDGFDSALGSAFRALCLRPDYHRGWLTLGNILKAFRRSELAARTYRRALVIDPDSAITLSNLGGALNEAGNAQAAIAALSQCLCLTPTLAEALANRGLAHQANGAFGPSHRDLSRALRLAPHLAEAEFSLACLELLTGDLKRGWRRYESRWRTYAFRNHRQRETDWNGADLQGGTLLLCCEQGLGDSIQFIRYAALARSRAGRVILACPPGLERLFHGIDGIDEIATQWDSLPPVAAKAALMSLPALLGAEAIFIPGAMPYLKLAPSSTELWQGMLERFRKPRIGLAWRGSAAHQNDRNRSIDARAIRRLCDNKNASFIGLQTDMTEREVSIFSDAENFLDAGPALKDMAETAALTAHLDLIISVDTSVIHLAGALGREAWLALPFVPDWRWGTERRDSFYYPSLTLYRQSAACDWAEVIDEIEMSLVRWIADRDGT